MIIITGSNSSSESKQSSHNTNSRSEKRPNINEKKDNDLNFQSTVRKNAPETTDPPKYSDLYKSASSPPFEYIDFSRSTSNPFEYNDLSRLAADKSCDTNLNVRTNNVLAGTSSNRLNFEKKEISYYSLNDKLHNLAFTNNTIGTHPEFAREALSNKGKCLDDNYAQNKPANISAVPPSQILTKDNFMTKWFSWKSEFLTYMKLIDQTESNKQKWGFMLLNRIGPVGQEIYRTFTFDYDRAKEDVDILLEKFDKYCIFGDRKREDGEDIDKYVNNLKVYILINILYIFK